MIVVKQMIVIGPGLVLAALLVTGCLGGGQAAERHGEAATTAAGDEHGEHEEHGEHDEHGEHEGEEGVVELSPEAIARVGLATAPASLRPLVDTRATTGMVGYDERHLAHVSARVAGRLVRIDADLGDQLREGEVLAIVDSVELGQARADYLRARARLEVARRRFERERSLHAERITSEQQVLEAEAEAREAAADFAAAGATLRLLGLSEDEVEALSWDDAGPSLTPVRAPFAGRVVAKEATRGELVTPESTLFTVADLAVVWLWIDVYERDLRRVRAGEAVAARFDAWPGEVFSGELVYLADELDSASRTVKARADLPNPERRLKPGMFARVTLAGGGETGAVSVLAVPREAVQRQATGAMVFVATGDGRFERRRVEVGRTTDAWVEIQDGLAAGESVVTAGAFLLKSQTSAGQLGGHHH